MCVMIAIVAAVYFAVALNENTSLFIAALLVQVVSRTRPIYFVQLFAKSIYAFLFPSALCHSVLNTRINSGIDALSIQPPQ